MPVIIVSSLTTSATRIAIEAMEAGAVDVVCKPGSSYTMENLSPLLIKTIKIAARTRVQLLRPATAPMMIVQSPATTTSHLNHPSAAVSGVNSICGSVHVSPPYPVPNAGPKLHFPYTTTISGGDVQPLAIAGDHIISIGASTGGVKTLLTACTTK